MWADHLRVDDDNDDDNLRMELVDNLSMRMDLVDSLSMSMDQVDHLRMDRVESLRMDWVGPSHLRVYHFGVYPQRKQ